MLRSTATAAILALSATGAMADPATYTLDPSHSQILFSYDHLGFSTTYGMFSGFEGEIQFDEDDPAASSVSVSMPVTEMFTGWEARDAHFLSEDFFNAIADGQPIDPERNMVTFESTSIEVTGDETANITGNLTMNGITQEVVLDTSLNGMGPNPINQTPTIGFDATTTIKRSDFGVGAFAPAVSDEVEVQISLEAMQPEA
ncbi:polyisoprenoid-binding protein YceI [Hasllibacter halocynthiae]|uniref:Polyisoprenoid-binding protein YceI n=1 Tax=Hasllibacter halocynthiae TaxID=595589 RepID=A0A2T0X8V5_9RHOB|nr:YceI family protein [Hasllibacter halocynthiae]PRY95380.1 polyisoprenoid-binding protein YceI [Hasllibacter halocynthiae]